MKVFIFIVMGIVMLETGGQPILESGQNDVVDTPTPWCGWDWNIKNHVLGPTFRCRKWKKLYFSASTVHNDYYIVFDYYL